MKIFRRIIFCSILILGSLFLANNSLAQEVDLGNSNLQCYCTCQSLDVNDEVDGGSLAVGSEEVGEQNIDDEEEDEPLVPVQIQNEILPGEILISEFVADPISGQKEWVEIYNTTDEMVDLAGWVLLEGSGQSTALNTFINSHDYLKIEKSSLNNSGDIIILKDSQMQIIDQVSYGDWDDGNLFDNAPMANDPSSIIRKNVSMDYNIDFQDFYLTITPTPGDENIFTPLEIVEEEIIEEVEEEIILEEENEIVEEIVEEVPELQPLAIDYSQQIRITEVFPNPTGSDSDMEWIELKNISNKEINLKNWKVDDDEGGSSMFTFDEDTVLGVGEYFVLSNTQSKLILNNTEDAVRLFAPDQALVDSVFYQEVIEDYSYAVFDQGWAWTLETTAGKDNVLYVVNNDSGGLIKIASASEKQTLKEDDTVEYLSTSIENIYNLTANQKVDVTGIVTVAPGIFSSKSLYLQNEKGIEIYDSNENFPVVKEGQTLNVQGKISSAQGDKRVLASGGSVEIVDEKIALVVPEILSSEDLGDNYLLSLIEVEGVLVQKNSNKLIVADEFGEVVVYLKASTNISSKIFNVGERLKIVGILSLSDGEYRIMPRRSQDILNLSLQELPIVGQIATDEDLPSNTDNGMLSYVVVAVCLLSGAIFYGLKNKEKIKKLLAKVFKKKLEPQILDFSVLQNQK